MSEQEEPTIDPKDRPDTRRPTDESPPPPRPLPEASDSFEDDDDDWIQTGYLNYGSRVMTVYSRRGSDEEKIV